MTLTQTVKTIRVSSIVDVRTFTPRSSQDGGPIGVEKVKFELKASSKGEQWVQARVNGHEIGAGLTDTEGFYVTWVNRDVLNVNKDEVNRFRFIRPNGKKVKVDLENKVNLVNWKG